MTAAMELSRMGILVRIVDKATGPSTTSRALVVQARTIELLEQRGLADEMLNKGNQATATTIYDNGKTLGKVDLKLISSRYNFCLLIPQSDTEEILRKQLKRQNVTIEWQTELTDFTQLSENRGIVVTLKQPGGIIKTFTASYLISAEGAHSVSRIKLGIEFSGKTMGQNYALGDLHIDGDIPDDELSVFIGKKGFLAVFPLTGQRFRLMVTDSKSISKNNDPPSLEYLQRLYDAIVHIPGKLYQPLWTSRFGINSRMVHTLRVGNVFLGGDTAHIHSPAGGQGMNTGMQDMINLSWKLAFVLKGYAKPKTLDTYEDERLPVITSLLSTTERATDLFNSTNPFVQLLMKTLLPPVLSLGTVQKEGGAVISEVSHSYHGGNLANSGNPVNHLKAGDRLPNWDFEINAVSSNGKAKKKATLYQLLDPSKFTLLLVNGKGIKIDLNIKSQVINTWHLFSESDRFTGLFGEEPSFILARPDTYIAVLGSHKDSDMLYEWLNEWLNL